MKPITYPRTLFQPRVLAVIRCNFPGTFLLFGWLLGVVCGVTSVWLIPVLFAALCLARGSVPRVVLLAAVCAGFTQQFSAQPAVEFDKNPSTFLLTVEQPPRHRQPGGIEFVGNAAHSIHEGRYESLTVPFKVLCKAAYLPWRGTRDLGQGDTIAVLGEFEGVPDSGIFSYHGYLRRQGIQAMCKAKAVTVLEPGDTSKIETLRMGLRSSLESVLAPGEKSGLVLSLAFGFRDVVSQLTEDAFKRTGLAHLLVLSGAQVTTIYLSVLLMLRFALFCCCNSTPAVKTIAQLTAFLTAFGFVCITGIEGPSLRAILAVAVLFCTILLGRRTSGWQVICLTLLVISASAPGAILDPSVELTFAALLGLLLGFAGNGTKLKKLLRAAIFASLATSAVTVVRFGSLSLWGFLLNPLIAPLISMIGVQGAYVAVLANLAGLDSQGILLKLVADLLESFRDFVIYLSGYEFSAIEVDPSTAIIIAIAMVVPLLFAAFKAVKIQIASHGL